MLAPQELRDIHPLGKSPVITVESPAASKPLVIAESAFIVEYLAEHFGPWLVPNKYTEGKEKEVGGESEEWLRYRFFMHYAEGSLMTYLLVLLLVSSQYSSIQSAHAGTTVLISLQTSGTRPYPSFLSRLQA